LRQGRHARLQPVNCLKEGGGKADPNTLLHAGQKTGGIVAELGRTR
jgi:hypothetical protein